MKNDFKVQVIVNNRLHTVLADTGASISVCGRKEAEKCDLEKKMVKSNARIKHYNSQVIPILGVARCAVSFRNNSVPVEWHTIENTCEPILSGKRAEQLGIIRFASQPDVFYPVNMIEHKEKGGIQEIIQQYPSNFKGIGKLKNTQVKLYYDKNVKPVAEPARTIAYHLTDRVNNILQEMVKQDIIEQQPNTEPITWVSNIVIAPKSDGDIRLTLDARNINKAIYGSNSPIPRHEDIKAKLSGATILSKLDLKSAYWQLELEPESRKLTTFHANGKLFRYKCLSMGIKSAAGELNASLDPLFADIPHMHIIHDLIIAAPTLEEHNSTLKQVMEVCRESGLTFNSKKCAFGKSEIEFWGLLVNAQGTQPSPAKVEALKYMSPPTNKSELISFICMMQSNAEFIPHFSQKAAKLRELIKGNAKFTWGKEHKTCFKDLVHEFKQETLLHHFDLKSKIFVFVDAHKTGLGAILAQGDAIQNARPVAIASRTTSDAEQRYPQIDLEALTLDFALRRFRNYLVGAPDKVQVITDHKPLCAIFNGRNRGSIRTDRIKLRHQDINFHVLYQQGKNNPTDYLSRHAKPFEKLALVEQIETNDLNNILYMIHSTPAMDSIGLALIATETAKDKTLHKLKQHRGAHPGQSGLERRLRYNFFIPDLNKKVADFVHHCSDCSAYVNKKTLEPIKHHKIPDKSWDTVSVDLYGPMPSSRHIVVVQDLSSRFPAAKLVTSTKASKVLPALEEIYDSYGNPRLQISDNGPPFKSQNMHEFLSKRDISSQTIPPLHPSSNPVENFMRPLGKGMKIGRNNNQPEQETLKQILNSYRQTPHPSTGLPPGDRMFRDGLHSNFPQRRVTEEMVKQAQLLDKNKKLQNENNINVSKYRKKSNFVVGDGVLLKNLLFMGF